ncbi:LysR family transcriptional regulator [Kiloniella laminariae]|uniref:LysR family transcriptional regulator n=1 Tax=Kiloniella laminariae TaxID=454162 RepID=A0ABT4LJB8_9PROT|nr:LysR family transcriptional regulator [Kiloniella laminariae]MCZ4281201.1 LysR family transcriptional regulator [Kiloniella laminariae]
MQFDHLPPLQWLRVFEAAARQQNFAGAARELAMTPSAISQQIKALESRLGWQLFTRSAHGVQLNKSGRDYLPVVQQALQILNAGTGAVFGKNRQKPLVIRCSLAFACFWLSPRLSDFRELYPEIQLQLLCSDTTEISVEERSDIRIIFGGSHPPERTEELFGEVIFPVCTPAIAGCLQDPRDLGTFPLIEISGHKVGWSHYLSATGVEDSIDIERIVADNTVLGFSMAAAGCGIALARAPLTDLALTQFGLVSPFDIKIPGPERFHLLLQPAAIQSETGRIFRQWLKNRIRIEQNDK